MAVKPDETVLIITDEPARSVGYALWEAAKEEAAEAIITEITPRESNGEEPPDSIAELMKSVDVVLIPTSKSLSHTDSRRAASNAGVRIATLPGITEDMMIRTMNADFNQIAECNVHCTNDFLSYRTLGCQNQPDKTGDGNNLRIQPDTGDDSPNSRNS